MMLKSQDKIGIWSFLLFSDEKVSPIDKCKRIADTLVALITAIGFIPAGVYTAQQYLEEQQARRVDKTLEFYTKQLDDKLLESRKALDVFYHLDLRQEYLEAISISKKNNDDEKKREFIAKLSKQNSEHIMILEKFYEGVAKCTKTNICDQETAEELFKQDIQDFVVIFGPFLCTLRKDLKDPTIAKELTDFYGSKNPLCNNDDSYGK